MGVIINISMKIIRLLGNYLKNILISLDQVVNVLFFGNPDETISSRAYRLHFSSSTWSFIKELIDVLFFWDSFVSNDGVLVKHCQFSYLVNLKRKQSSIETSLSKDSRDLMKQIKNDF